jgi:hypothetical protein
MIKSHPLFISLKKPRIIFFMKWLHNLVNIEGRIHFFVERDKSDGCEAAAADSGNEHDCLGLLLFPVFKKL